MTATKDQDWQQTGTIAAMGEWLRRESGAICVLVIRRDDAILATDARLAPADALRLIEDYAPGLARNIESARKDKRAAARIELGELRE